jgi:predicted transcriptional regulator
MAYVISKIGAASNAVQNRIRLSCMNLSTQAKCKSQIIDDCQKAHKNIEQAVKMRQQLDADLYDVNKRISRSIEAKQKNGLI